MKKIRKIMAIILIVSLTSGVSAREIESQYTLQSDKKSAVELREKLAEILCITGGAAGLAGSFMGCHPCSEYIFGPKTIKVGKYLFRIGLPAFIIGIILLDASQAKAAEMPKTAEQNMSRLRSNPFLLLDKKSFTDYDIDITELKYPEELMEYMNKFQTFLEFSKKENKERFDSTNWDEIKEAAYLKAGSPQMMNENDSYMSYQEIMNDEYFYTEFLSYGYWPQFLDAFNEYIENKALEEKKSLENAIKNMLKNRPPKDTDVIKVGRLLL